MEANPSLNVSSRDNTNSSHTTDTNNLDENNNLLLKTKNSIMDAMSNLVDLNKPNLSFKFDLISDITTSSILINTAEKSIAYRLPCNLVEAELKKCNFDRLPNKSPSSHFYQLLRKLIDLSKAYYLNLSNHEEEYLNEDSEKEKEKEDNEKVEKKEASDDERKDVVNEQLFKSHNVELINDANIDRSEMCDESTKQTKQQEREERDIFSEHLTRQLIDESFDQLAKYDQFASGLVDDLFDELRASASRNILSAAIDFNIAPLNIAIPENDELDHPTTSNSDRCDTLITTLTPKSNNSSTANTPPLFRHFYNHSYTYHGIESRSNYNPSAAFRRHSADVDKIFLNTNRYNKCYHVQDGTDRYHDKEVSSRRHSLNLANNSSHKDAKNYQCKNQTDINKSRRHRLSVPSEFEQANEETRSEDNHRQSRPRHPTPSSYDENSEKRKPIGLVLDNNKYLLKKPPVIALMLTTTTQSKDEQNLNKIERDDYDDESCYSRYSRRPSTIASFKSHPDLNYHRNHHIHHYYQHQHQHFYNYHHHFHNRFKQYRKVTLRNFFQKSPNQIRKEMIFGNEKSKSIIEKTLEKSSYVNSLVCDIVNSAYLETSYMTNLHVKFAKSLEANIFSLAYDEIKKIENLNKLKHIFFHCECLNPHNNSVTSQESSYLTCKITVYSMIIALNEFNFTNLVTFKCSHLNNL